MSQFVGILSRVLAGYQAQEPEKTRENPNDLELFSARIFLIVCFRR
jgi:hypothetical protein